MDNKECEFKYKCYYSNDDCGIIKDVCVHREKLMEIIKLGDQYNAVVAQNKSLQGELRLRQQMIDYLLTADILSTQNFSSESDFNSHFCKEYERIEQICIQELEVK